MLSIRPQWCESIKSGKKTLEIRKTLPKLQPPFKCFIYCTKAPKGWYNFASKQRLDGMVIGEFICDAIVIDRTYGHDSRVCAAACMNQVQAASYCTNSKMYGWHISELIIYDEPRKLQDFRGLRKTKFGWAPTRITRPPQSWYYVEEVKEK